MTENKVDAYRGMIQALAEGKAEVIKIEVGDEEPLMFWRALQLILADFPNVVSKLEYTEETQEVVLRRK